MVLKTRYEMSVNCLISAVSPGQSKLIPSSHWKSVQAHTAQFQKSSTELLASPSCSAQVCVAHSLVLNEHVSTDMRRVFSPALFAVFHSKQITVFLTPTHPWKHLRQVSHCSTSIFCLLPWQTYVFSGLPSYCVYFCLNR